MTLLCGNKMTPTATILADDKAALQDAIKRASFNHVTLIYLRGYNFRITINPLSARKEYEGRVSKNRGEKLQTLFETRYTNKLQRMVKELKKMDLQPFKQFI